MNAYAAQVVLSKLRASDDDRVLMPNSMMVYGLPAFIVMSMEQRFSHFEQFLGGRKVLHRVSELVDATWMIVQGDHDAMRLEKMEGPESD